jgi:quercetin dioxygenase-like cupin family protein
MAAAKATEAPPHRLAGGKGTAQLLLNASTSSPSVAMTAVTFEKGSVVPEHAHDASDEALHALAGTFETECAWRKARSGPGDTVLLPAGVPHSATALSAVNALRVYFPAGAAQRFAAGPNVGSKR